MGQRNNSVFALLQILERDRLCKLDPRLVLAIEAILQANSHESHERLAAALASLCTHDSEKWGLVHQRALRYFRDLERLRSRAPKAARELPPPRRPSMFDPSPGPLQDEPPGDNIFADFPLPRTDVRAEQVVQEALADAPPRRSPRRIWLAVAITVTLIAVLGALQEKMAVDLTDRSPPPTTPPADSGSSRPPASSPSTPATPATPATSWREIALAFVGSCGAVVLGVRLLFAPTVQRLVADLRRKDALPNSRGVRVLYNVPRELPFTVGVVDAAADALARIPSRDHGIDLDVSATLDATIRAGGQIVPLMEPGKAPQPLIVMVSQERGDHPMLGPIEGILGRWQETGFAVRRFDFRYQLESIRAHHDRTITSLDTLSRRTEGSPLLIFARSTSLASKARRYNWLRCMRSWPTRALLDLDPRLDDELAEDELHSRQTIDMSGLRRFSFTARGLDAAARYLGSGGQVLLDVPDEPLPPRSIIDDALARWAQCLACVPDPSWAQLEVFRRRFNRDHFGGRLTDFRVVERLLEWLVVDLERRGLPSRVVKGSGEGIRLDELPIIELLARLSETDCERHQALEAACHRVLLEQLRAAAPRALLDRLMQQLKIVEHEALLVLREPNAPSPSGDFAQFRGTAVEADARHILARHAARFRAIGTTFPARLDETIGRFEEKLLSPAQALARRGWRAALLPIALGLGAMASNLLMLVAVVLKASGPVLLAGAAASSSSLGALGVLFMRRMRAEALLAAMDDIRSANFAGLTLKEPSSVQNDSGFVGTPEQKNTLPEAAAHDDAEAASGTAQDEQEIHFTIEDPIDIVSDATDQPATPPTEASTAVASGTPATRSTRPVTLPAPRSRVPAPLHATLSTHKGQTSWKGSTAQMIWDSETRWERFDRRDLTAMPDGALTAAGLVGGIDTVTFNAEQGEASTTATVPLTRGGNNDGDAVAGVHEPPMKPSSRGWTMLGEHLEEESSGGNAIAENHEASAKPIAPSGRRWLKYMEVELQDMADGNSGADSGHDADNEHDI